MGECKIATVAINLACSFSEKLESKTMATEAKTATIIVVEASTKVAAAITELVKATVNVISKKRALAEIGRSEANRLGYDRKQASQMFALSWSMAYGYDRAPEAERNAFLLKSRPDISKVVSLAYPENPAELAAAYAHNDKLGNKVCRGERLGENMLLEISRGNLTFKQATAVRKAKSKKVNPVLTFAERFENVITRQLGEFNVSLKNGLTVDEVKAIFAKALATYLASLEKDEKKS